MVTNAGSTSVQRAVRNPYLQTGDMYLDLARERGDFTDADYELLIMPMPDVDQAANPERVIDAYRAALGRGKSEREAITEVNSRLVKFSRMSKGEQEATLAGKRMPRIGVVGRTLRKVSSFNQIAREGQMYNVTKIVTRPLADGIGGAVHMLVSGNVKGATRQLRQTGEMAKILATDPGKAISYISRQNNGFLAGLDTELPVIIRGDYASGRDKYGLAAHDLKLHNWAKENRLFGVSKVAAWVLANERTQSMSHAMDTMSRENLGIVTLADEIAKVTKSFMTEVLDADGLNGEDLVKKFLEEARTRTKMVDTSAFSPEDVTAVLTAEGVKNPSYYARIWTDAREEALNNTIEVNRKVLFTGDKVRRYEEGLGHVMYYYYWQSRSLNLAARSAMKNPLLMSSYVKMWNGAQNEAERNGYPKTFIGTLSFWGDPGNAMGWYGLTNALGVIVPGFMMSEWYDLNKSDADSPWYEQLSKVFPVTSTFGAAWAALGHSDEVPDLIGTRQVENYVLAVLDWGNSKGMDFTNGQPVESIIEKVERKLLEGANAAVRGLGIADGEYVPYVPSTGKKDVIKSVLWQHAVEDWGVDPTKWTPEQWNEISVAMTVIDEGSGSSGRADRAYGEWANYVLLNRGASLVTPGGSILRYNPRERARNAAKKGDPNAQLQRDVITGAPETRDLEIQQQQVNAASTDVQRAAKDYWNMIVYQIADKPELYPDEMTFPAAVGVVSAKALRAMTEDERKEIANRYLAVTGLGDDRAQYYENTQAAINTGKVPEVKAYEDYKDLIQRFPGETREFRNWARSANPYYAKIEDEARKRFEAKIKDPVQVEAALDSWVFSTRAYQAFRGRKFSMYDADPKGGSAPDTGAALGVGMLPNTPTDAERIESEVSSAGSENNLVRLALGQRPVTVSSSAMAYEEWRNKNGGTADDYLRYQSGAEPLPQYFRR
jgi:hypothetical protein